MLDVIIDTLIDTIKLVPFLFIAFLIIELLEHRLKSNKKIKEAGKLGPVVGGLLGAIPQCGFAAAATNLYITRLITLGTLIAVYLSTSDEMIPIMLSENVSLSFVLQVVGSKVVIGITWGFIIDALFKKRDKENYHLCEEEHCHCDENIWLSVVKHTFNIALFILLIDFGLNLIFFYGGQEILSKLLMKNSIFGSFITSLIGLIPNCAASIIITQLYLSEAISYGAMIGGLLTGSGIALVILFKSNKNMKENFQILGIVYSIGVLCGLIIDTILLF